MMVVIYSASVRMSPQVSTDVLTGKAGNKNTCKLCSETVRTHQPLLFPLTSPGFFSRASHFLEANRAYQL